MSGGFPLPPLGGPFSDMRRSVIDPVTGNATLGAQVRPSAVELGGAYLDLLGQRAWSAVTAPRDAYTGDLQVFDPTTGHVSAEATKRAGGMAGLAMTGSLALPVPQGALRMFGGRNAATADLKALGQAEMSAGRGASREEILTNTGWFRGADGGARFEISDDAAKLSPFPPTAEAPLGLVLDHPALYAAYPDLKDTKVYHRPEMGTAAGATPEANYVALNLEHPQALSKLLHETSHLVEHREGFARGGAPNEFTAAEYQRASAGPSADADAFRQWQFDQYRRLAGEVDARNVQSRRDMTPAERRFIPPWYTQDVPDAKQILRFGD